jgi:hypothetical protein
LQSPNPVKEQMLDAEDVENASVNAVVADGVAIQAPPSTPPIAHVNIVAPLPWSPLPAAVAVGNTVATKAEDAPSTPINSATPPATPPRSGNVAAVPPASPQSPNTNRSRFLQGCQPVRICCNLDLMRATAGAKITITAICIAVFPASKNPDRRYIQLCDAYGSAGLTVWNHNVNLFGSASVGKLVTCKRLVVSSHNGKRCLTMARDSTIEIDDDGQHSVVQWWRGLLQSRPLTALEAHDSADNTIISLSGVVGQVTEEAKIVAGISRVLTTIHLVDATGKFCVRSWNHVSQQFQSIIDQPVNIHRVRVTAFAGDKLAELLDGNGSVILTDFPGCTTLGEWWSSA